MLHDDHQPHPSSINLQAAGSGLSQWTLLDEPDEEVMDDDESNEEGAEAPQTSEPEKAD